MNDVFEAGPVLRGRADECGLVRDLLAGARDGKSGVLIVRGDPGIGKSALLDFSVSLGIDFTVLRVSGVESEMELPYAALHQFCRPMLPHLQKLPGPQRAALATAFGLESGVAPERFFVGLAALHLLAEHCSKGPILCLVDDTQWMDATSLETLAFIARRLYAEPVAMIFATRDSEALPGLNDCELKGLGRGDSYALLESAVWWPMDDEVRGRLVDEAHGNPLALLELPKGMSPAELAGGFALADARIGTVTTRIEKSFLRRVRGLPGTSQELMLLAAAEPVGDPQRLRKAAECLGLPSSASDVASASGLLEIGRRVVFRHPLVRSAVYNGASDADRRKVHLALAEISDPVLDGDRRAWHRAQAVVDLDEEVAHDLVQSASRAQARGGWAAAAAFLERAVDLTADPSQRANRARDAADASLLAGAFEQAEALTLIAEASPTDDIGKVRDDVLRAKLAFATNHGDEAAPLLLAAARGISAFDLNVARSVFLEAFAAARIGGRSAVPVLLDVAIAAREVGISPAKEKTATSLLIDTLTEMFTNGYEAAAPLARQTIAEFASADISTSESMGAMWLAAVLAQDFWDDRAEVINDRFLTLARASGALRDLPLALDARAFLHLLAGEVDAASVLVDEKRVVCEATGISLAPYAALCLAAWRGQADALTRLVEESLPNLVSRGAGGGVTVLRYTEALLWNGLGQHERAVEAGNDGMVNAGEFGVANWVVVELIEGAVRCGDLAQARFELERLTALTSISRTTWARGMEARCAALLSDGAEAERLYREAIELLGNTICRAELARAFLLYGEWLRDANRREEARKQLRIAHTMFSEAGIVGFAERARRALNAVGERVRIRDAVESEYQLSAQEEQIARLAVEGMTNSEIGQRIFLSPRTVEWHMSKVFAKLGITSRRELREALPPRSAIGASASSTH
jgi:DNA-binding CsgD family transcriptional regulator